MTQSVGTELGPYAITTFGCTTALVWFIMSKLFGRLFVVQVKWICLCCSHTREMYVQVLETAHLVCTNQSAFTQLAPAVKVITFG